MLKQIGIMAVSVCGIALVVASQNLSSGEKPPEEEALVEAPVPAKTTKAASLSNDSDGDDFYGDEDTNFTFGEPMTSGALYGDETDEDDEEYNEPGAAPAKAQPYAKSKNKVADNAKVEKWPTYQKLAEPDLM